MKSRHAPGKLARSIVSNWATFLFSAGINFFVSPIVVGTLGETQYGAWVLLISMVGYLGLLDLGVRGAVTRYVAKFYAGDDHESATRLYSSALRIFTIAGGIAILASVVLAALADRIFNIPPELLQIGRVVTVISGVSVAVTLISGVFGGVIIGLERFDYFNVTEFVLSAARAIAVVTVLKTGNGLIALALVQLAATAARAILNVYLTRKLYPALKLTTWTWDRESARLIFSFGLTSSLLQATGALMLYSDSLVIGSLLPLGMITYFSIGGSLSEYARALVSGVSQTLSPRISALEASGKQSDLRTAVLTSARISSLVVMPIVVVFVLRGASFIGLWMGPNYSELSGKVLTVLSVTLATISGYQIVTAAMLGMSRQGGLIPVFLVEAVVNLLLSVLWVRTYGVLGTAVATAVPRVIISVLVGPWFVKRHLALGLREFWTSAYVRPVLAMAPFAAATFAIERFWPSHNLLMFFLSVFASLPLALIGSWFVCLSRREREMIAGFISRQRQTAVPAEP